MYQNTVESIRVYLLIFRNAINGFIFIYLSHLLRHVSAGNYCRRQVVLQLYKRKN